MPNKAKAELKPYIVVSFDTTMAALSMEVAAKHYSLEGRLIPIPRKLSAGCGMAWCEPAYNEDRIRLVLDQEDIEYGSIARLEQ